MPGAAGLGAAAGGVPGAAGLGAAAGGVPGAGGVPDAVGDPALGVNLPFPQSYIHGKVRPPL